MVSIAVFAACNDDVTYADQVNRERSAINAYIADSGVNVISEDEFRSNNYTTDVSKNEFVLFESSGLYMQIVRKGTGKPIADGENARVLCRYTERNLLTDSVQISNTISPYYYRWVETMSVTNNAGFAVRSLDSFKASTSTVFIERFNALVKGSSICPIHILAIVNQLATGVAHDNRVYLSH